MLGSRGGNVNHNLSQSITNLQKANNNIIIAGAKPTQADKQQLLRRQIGGNTQSQADASKQHATLVVRNQINIINNNQSQQIFSKQGFQNSINNEYTATQGSSDPQFKSANAQSISSKNKKFLVN
jgi:hypothetical protein